MSDTPETNSIIRNAQAADHPPTRLAATLTVKCEKLERERDEANEELHKQLVQFDQLFDEAEKIRIERDEAREALEFRRELYKVQEQYLETARRERDEAREEAQRFRSLSYARSGIDKSASWFPWETSLNLAQKAQLLATEKHAK